MIVLDCEQNSPEWFQARSGIPTASCFDKIITSTGKKSTQAKAYMNKLVAEYFTKQKTETHTSEHMQRGIDLEAEAREYYEFISDCKVTEVGLVYRDEEKQESCSPDGFVENKGLEIKCPAAHTQVEYLINNKLPTKYVLQVQGSMWVTGFSHWDFFSYHPDLPHLHLTIKRDEAMQKIISSELKCFVKSLNERKKQIESMI